MESKEDKAQKTTVDKPKQSTTTTPLRIIPLPITATSKTKPQGMVRKVAVGEPNQSTTTNHETEKVLMILGATGAGKSTLINGMVNYIMGVQYKDDYRYKLIGDEGSGSQAHSQTKWITAYTLYKRENWKLPYTLTIIDTPGYGDTEGMERDKKITNQIKEFFSLEGPEGGIDHLNGIGFVVQAPLARLTPTQKYIFDSILSIFGNDIGKNIFMMVTFADGKEPPVLAAIKAAKFEFQRSFKFNNSALFTEVEKEDSQDDDEDEDENEEGEEGNNMTFNSMFWKMGEKSYKNFFRTFGKAQSVSLQLTKEVLQEREHLECVIQGLQQNIQDGLYKADQLHQEEGIIKDHEKDLLKNKDFIYEVTLTKQRKVDLPRGTHVTNCLKCNRTCHDNCAIPKDEDKAGCAAMDWKGYCGVCPGKCYWNDHVNNSYKFELYQEKEQRTSEELKSRYKDAKSKKTEVEKVTAGLKKDLENLYLTVFGMLRKANGILHRLDEIALRPNPLSEIKYIELLIETEKAEGKPGFRQRINALNDVHKEAKILAGIKDEKKLQQMINDAAHYCWNKLKFW